MEAGKGGEGMLEGTARPIAGGDCGAGQRERAQMAGNSHGAGLRAGRGDEAEHPDNAVEHHGRQIIQ